MSEVFSINEVYAQNRCHVRYLPGRVPVKIVDSFTLVQTEFMMEEN